MEGTIKEVNVPLLINNTKVGTDNGTETWFSEPHYSVKLIYTNEHKLHNVGIKGTYRSVNCLQSGPKDLFPKNICSECYKIPRLPSFKKRLILRSQQLEKNGKRKLNSIRNEYLTTKERNKKLKIQKEQLKIKESQVFFLSRENLRLKIRIRCLKIRISEFAKRGSIKSICYKLEKAANTGMLDDKDVF